MKICIKKGMGGSRELRIKLDGKKSQLLARYPNNSKLKTDLIRDLNLVLAVSSYNNLKIDNTEILNYELEHRL